MRRSRKLLLLLICLAAIVAASALGPLLSDINQPHHQGHPLKYWVLRVDVYHERSGERKQAEEAIRQMGTNTLPFLLKWMQYDEPAWRPRAVELARRYVTVPKWIDSNAWAFANWLEKNSSQTLAFNAAESLAALGPLATPIIPDLLRIVADPRSNRKWPPFTSSGGAATILSAIGTNALPALINAIEDPAFSGSQNYVLAAIRDMHPPPAAAARAVPILIRRLSQTNQPYLAAWTIGDLGAEPDLAVPALLACRSSTNYELSTYSLDALNKFLTNRTMVIEALTKCLNNTNPAVYVRAANVLGKFGAPSTGALPLLTNLLSNPQAHDAASNAILGITTSLLTNAPAR